LPADAAQPLRGKSTSFDLKAIAIVPATERLPNVLEGERWNGLKLVNMAKLVQE